jgi:flagellar basal body-associated protein FliL
MSTLLIVILSVIGFLALVVGGLIVLWFYQGGCCVRRIKAKITKKDFVAPVLKRG